MKKKYVRPTIKTKSIKVNWFSRYNIANPNDIEGLLLAGCTCYNGHNPSDCGPCAS